MVKDKSMDVNNSKDPKSDVRVVSNKDI